MINDVLVKFVSGEVPDYMGDLQTSEPLEHAHWQPPRTNTSFSRPTLNYLHPNSSTRERVSVLRMSSAVLPMQNLLTFGSRNKSIWALDAVSQRLTRGLLDWDGLRAELLHASEAKRDYEPLLDHITPDELWQLRQVLTSHHLDAEAERVLLILIADRVLAGESMDRGSLPALAVHLLGAGLDSRVRHLLRIWTADNYLRHAIGTELEHPRFGGSLDLLLARFNQIYRRFGLETVFLDDAGTTPFTRLRAEPAERIVDGPLVTVIMSCWSPGEELLLAVRSIIDQTYQNWELIVTDDASPDRHDDVLEQVALMDGRIRVIRNEVNAGTYIRRNEALDIARGKLVTMQDSDDWSHPRRLEIQVRDLEHAPDRFANVVRNVRLTEDLSLYSERGMQPGICEPAIMFRRESVLAKIGYFDGVRKAADREYRERLEAATGEPVPLAGPEVPLVLMLADVSSLSGSDFRGKWVHPARIAYRSSMWRVHDLIRDGEVSPHFPAHQTTRVLDAPAPLLGHSEAPASMDLLVILDGRPVSGRRQFLAEVTQELRGALDSGLVVGVMHSDSLRGGKSQGYFDTHMQELVDEAGLHRVIDDQQVKVGTVIVRHAVAAQGHPPTRRRITADRVVVIDDSDGGDERGVTYARADVDATLRGWFACECDWYVAAPRPLPPKVESIQLEGSQIKVAVSQSGSAKPLSLELRGVDGTVVAFTSDSETAPQADGTSDLAIYRAPIGKLGESPFIIAARLGSYFYPLDVDATRVLTTPGDRILVRQPKERLKLMSAKPPVRDGEDSASFPWLRGAVSALRLSNDRFTIDIDTDSSSKITEVVIVREVNGALRRREFALDQRTEDSISASRSFRDIVGGRWQLFGVFQTPVGRIQYELPVGDGVATADQNEWRIAVRAGRLSVVPKM
ncbi:MULTISPECIES: glycosyltransferase family 2 protein [unclassified Microbacterium]|uniref:glycosyltransferase family 2 protein n=1 Tax=unclassified Microbacterium TaxID=2609290 RepID=UPI003C2BB0AD